MTIRDLIDGIEKLDLVLPEFQREYVWEKEQAKQLIVSLFKGYPTGSLLFWKTDNPPEIKNNAVNREKIGTTMVILDGQQRLTTLYLLLKGKIPPYYIEQDIQNDPRNLYFDVDTGDFMYYQPKLMDSNRTWVSVMNCFNGKGPSVFEIAKAKAGEQGGDAAFKLAETYNEKLVIWGHHTDSCAFISIMSVCCIPISSKFPVIRCSRSAVLGRSAGCSRFVAFERLCFVNQVYQGTRGCGKKE